MKRTKTVISLVLASVLALSLVACSSGGSAASATPTASPSPVAKYPTEAITLIVNYSAARHRLAARALSDAASAIPDSPLRSPTSRRFWYGRRYRTGKQQERWLHHRRRYPFSARFGALAAGSHLYPEDFEYICAFGQYGYGIVVNADSDLQTLDDLIALAKTKSVKYGCTGYPQPFTMNELAEATGAQFEMVSYSSTTDLITDVLGGFVPFAMCDQASFASYVESGQMRLLASATDKRWEKAPEVPTLQELGYDIVCASYMGLCAPAGIDEDILNILRNAFQQAPKTRTTRISG